MIKIKIYTPGKNKEAWLDAALKEYEKRLSRFCMIEWIIPKNDNQLELFLSREPRWIGLDPHGKGMTSEQVEVWLGKIAIEFDARIVFVIGGPEGLTAQMKKNASYLWSLSPLTFTHQMCRLILVEQLYRAYEISRGSSYHK